MKQGTTSFIFRAITLLLACMCLLPLAVFSAEGTVYEIEEPQKELEVLSSLGLIERSEYRENTTFNRGELAEKLLVVLGMKDEIYTEHLSFSDVDYYDLNYVGIGVCVSRGILTGHSATEFCPTQESTVLETVVAMMRILGYQIPAEKKGGYPNGYITLANSIGLMDNLPSDAMNQPCTEWIFAKLFYNMLDVSVYGITSITLNDAVLERGGTYLEETFSIYEGTGILDKNRLTGISSSVGVKSGSVSIDSVQYETGSASYDEYLGYNLDFYYKESGSDRWLLYAVPAKTNSVLKLNSDTLTVKSGRIYYEDEKGREKSLALPPDADVLYNNQPLIPYSLSNFSALGEAYVTFIDNTGDGKYDVIKIEEFKNIYVKTADYDRGIIYDEYSSRNNLTVDTSDIGETILIYNSQSELVELESITQGALLSCLVSKNSAVVVIYNLVNEVIGTVESAEKDGSTYYKSLVIEGISYEIADSVKPYLNDISIGTSKIIAYTDMLGKIAAYTVSAKSEYTFAFLKAVGSESGLSPSVSVKLYQLGDEKGKFTVYDCAKYLYIDDVKYESNTDTAKATACKNKINESANKLVAISVNAEGKLAKMKTIAGGGLLPAGSVTNGYYVADSPSGYLGTTMAVASDVQILFLPSTYEEKYFYTGGKGNMVHDQQYSQVDGYKLDADRIAPEVMVSVTPVGGSGIPSGAVALVVTGVTRSIIDEEGTEGRKITCYNEGVKQELYMADDVDYTTLDGQVATDVQCGDVLLASVSAPDILSAVLIFRPTSNDWYASGNPNVSWATGGRIFKGWIYKKHDAQVLLSFTNPASASFSESALELRNISNRTKLYVYDSSKPIGKRVALASDNDLVAYYDAGSSASYVFGHTSGSLMKVLMVIK